MNLSPSPIETSAVSAMNQGRIAEAERLCREAVTKDGNEYRCRVLLSAILRERSALEESAEIAEQAIAIRPTLVEAHYQFALAMLDLGRPEAAETTLRKAISLRPEVGQFHLSRGLSLVALGRGGDAKAAFIQCLNLDPNNLQARLCLVEQLLAESDIENAVVVAEASQTMAPKSAAANLTLAEALLASGRGPEAETFLRAALELNPNSSAAQTMLGFRQSQVGQFDAAEASFRKSIALAPKQGYAYLGLSQIRKALDSNDPWISELERVRDRGQLDPAESSWLCFALAKAYGDIRRFEDSAHHYELAHERAAKVIAPADRFDAKTYGGIVDQISAYFSGLVVDTPWPSADPAPTPIFIVGMIRSGTTLVEQILSSHPDVGGSGENPFWARAAGRWRDLVELSRPHERGIRLATDYLRNIDLAAPGSRYVTDKLPGNYLRLGLIHLLLPNAKIIHCRRKPLDTAFSIWTTPNRSAPSFSHSREAIVFAYEKYLELMEHWRRVLPPEKILEVDYESLVESPECVVPQMLRFLSLSWDPKCLRPEVNSKEVLTPSVWQVRQPIYRSSVERWRGYEPWLGVLRELDLPPPTTSVGATRLDP